MADVQMSSSGEAQASDPLSSARQALDMYRLLAHNASDVVAKGSNDGHIDWISPSVEALLGRSPEDMVGTAFIDYVHREDRPMVVAGQHRILAGEQARFEIRLLANDGSYRWFSLVAKPVFDENDDVVGRIVGWHDIHAEHEIRESLAVAEQRFRLMAEHALDVLVHTVDGVIEWVSPSVTKDAGWLPEELIGTPSADLIHPDDREAALAVRQLSYHGEAGRGRWRLLRKDGSYGWVDVSLQPYGEPDGRSGAVAVIRDVTDDVALQQALVDSEARNRLFVESVSDVVATSDASGHLTWLSPSVEALLGWRPDQLLGTLVTDLLHPDDVSTVVDAQESIRNGVEGAFEARVRQADGSYRWIASHVTPIAGPDGQVVSRVAGWRDVESERAVLERVRQSEARYRLLAENAWDVIWTMELDGTISYVSPSVERVRGITPDEAKGQTLDQIHTPESAMRVMEYYQQLNEAMAAGAEPPRFHGEMEYLRKDGSIMFGELDVVPLLDDDGHPVQILGVTRDISERKRFEAELNLLVVTDPLTGVWNRRHAESLLTADILEARRYGPPMSLLMLDIDHFKLINDTHGHQVGDHVLVGLTRLLAANLRTPDVLARWGGEEFVIVMRNCTIDDAVQLGEKLRVLVANECFENLGPVTISIGAAQLLPEDDLDSWLRRADSAMYEAKASGRNAVRASD